MMALPFPEILLVIGGVFPPSSLTRVTRILTRQFFEAPVQVVRPDAFIVPGTCSEK